MLFHEAYGQRGISKRGTGKEGKWHRNQAERRQQATHFPTFSINSMVPTASIETQPTQTCSRRTQSRVCTKPARDTSLSTFRVTQSLQVRVPFSAQFPPTPADNGHGRAWRTCFRSDKVCGLTARVARCTFTRHKFVWRPRAGGQDFFSPVDAQETLQNDQTMSYRYFDVCRVVQEHPAAI